MTRAKNGKFIAKKWPISKEEIANVAYAIHQQAKADGDELENPSKCAKAALRVLGYDVESAE